MGEAMKKQIAVVFGGKSSEHEISCISAGNIIRKIDRERYDVHAIGIDMEGTWRYIGIVSDDDSEVDARICDKAIADEKRQIGISMDRKVPGLLINDNEVVRCIHIDVWFPVLHGRNGEDGTIQGLFEMSGIPYVGCGVMASSAGMDKISTKNFADHVGVTQAKYVIDVSKNSETVERTVERAEAELGYPMFVKPSNAGSSKGVSKAHNREELIKAIASAKENDHRILIEEFIDGREVECAVLGGEQVEASCVGEILSAAEFYDFDAKYNNAASKTVVDPEDLPDEAKAQIREDAVMIFKALDGYGLARVDFFVRRSDGCVIFNEINTLPGFTNISMYPMLWAAMGVEQKELITKLIEIAAER